METSKQPLELSCGTVYLKEFINRKTMRDYRKIMMTNAKMVPKKDSEGKRVINEKGIPENELDIDPGQMDACNEALVLGIIDHVEATKDAMPVTVNQAFIDEMASDDFEAILAEALQMMKKDDEEKKSS